MNIVSSSPVHFFELELTLRLLGIRGSHRRPKASTACPICALDMDDLDLSEREDHVAAHLGSSSPFPHLRFNFFPLTPPPSCFISLLQRKKTKTTAPFPSLLPRTVETKQLRRRRLVQLPHLIETNEILPGLPSTLQLPPCLPT